MCSLSLTTMRHFGAGCVIFACLAVAGGCSSSDANAPKGAVQGKVHKGGKLIVLNPESELDGMMELCFYAAKDGARPNHTYDPDSNLADADDPNPPLLVEADMEGEFMFPAELPDGKYLVTVMAYKTSLLDGPRDDADVLEGRFNFRNSMIFVDLKKDNDQELDFDLSHSKLSKQN